MLLASSLSLLGAACTAAQRAAFERRYEALKEGIASEEWQRKVHGAVAGLTGESQRVTAAIEGLGAGLDLVKWILLGNAAATGAGAGAMIRNGNRTKRKDD